MKSLHLHLISDSTGETVSLVARATLVQFEDVDTTEHIWALVRNQSQISEVIAGIKANPGFVLYTLVDDEIRHTLEKACRELNGPCLAILDPIFAALSSHLGAEIHHRPGYQHVMDAEYFKRIEAMHYVLSHDDGQSTGDLEQADVLVLGVSRTCKTPTCIYLANRGIKAANIPIVPGCPLPDEVMKINKPVIIGLTSDPKRLIEIRRNRLRMLMQDEEVTDYVDVDTVTREVNEARRLFSQNDWPVINVTRRSIEEVAATILQLYTRHHEELS